MRPLPTEGFHPVAKPIVLIAEELSPATIEALGPDFDVRSVDGTDRAALAALQAGQLGYLGLDVYEYEKGLYFEDHSQQPATDSLLTELLAQPNVLITAHQAFLTREALASIAATTIASLDAWAQSKPAEHELTASPSPVLA